MQMLRFQNAVQNFIQLDRDLNLRSRRWVENDQLFWSQACDNESGGYRMGMMTSNIVESINGVFKGIRAMPIAAIVIQTMWLCVSYFDKRRNIIQRQVDRGGVFFTKRVAKLLERRQHLANTMSVQTYDYNSGIFECTAPPNYELMIEEHKYVVNLNHQNGSGTRECGRFQALKIPCSHAIACLNKIHINPKNFVNTCYRLATLNNVYGQSFILIGDPAGWDTYGGPKLVPNMGKKRGKGKPRTARIRNEMDWPQEDRQPQTCTMCRQVGHNRSTCPQITR
ncbi:hypothetical protein LINPERHAP1_LOCUS5973 [Linum perenne]